MFRTMTYSHINSFMYRTVITCKHVISFMFSISVTWLIVPGRGGWGAKLTIGIRNFNL